MEGNGCFGRFFHSCKPYIAMISLQFGYAGMIIIAKVSLNNGMSHYVLVVYRHVFATLAIAPFAIVLERKIRPKITFVMFIQMFMLGLLGPVIDQNLYYAGLKFTSPTYSCAINNMLPAMTFVMAVIFRNYEPVENTDHSNDKDLVKGSILVMISTLAWAAFFILQASQLTLRRYTSQLSLTAIVCFLGTLQSIVVTYVMEPKISGWSIGWDMNLLVAAYAGIVCSGIAYYVQGIVMQKRGPVFVTAFNPLLMLIVVIMESFILGGKTYLGGVIGAFMILMGLYSVLWGKYNDLKEQEAEILTKEIKYCTSEKCMREIMIEDAKANDIKIQEVNLSKSQG
ncbi:unnamed protein product [Lupinus luteus]|uniref:WAT1-related protein n=1 Tax=Lupinus luteus TaxID=3873 RepID=A0AAV1XPA6_LUPLU